VLTHPNQSAQPFREILPDLSRITMNVKHDLLEENGLPEEGHAAGGEGAASDGS
jgi:hypothetical protein